MTTKEYYKRYLADDFLNDISFALFNEIEKQNPIHVLDFGCGTGKNINILNKRGVCTIGIDISPMNVFKAVTKYELPCVMLGDETYLRNFCNVDVVFCCSVMCHMENIDGVIEEFKRIANKAVIIAETNDKIGQYYFPHNYQDYGFVDTGFEWIAENKGLYRIWRFLK